MISTRDLRLLPEVARLRAAFQSMAMLDAIIMPGWEFRYYSFETDVSPDGSISIGSMRNGSGDDLHAIFGPGGCLILRRWPIPANVTIVSVHWLIWGWLAIPRW